MKLKKTDYIKLVGLLALAPQHNRALDDIHRAVCEIVGEDPDDCGHASDAVFSGYSADELLRKLAAQRKREGKK